MTGVKMNPTQRFILFSISDLGLRCLAVINTSVRAILSTYDWEHADTNVWT